VFECVRACFVDSSSVVLNVWRNNGVRLSHEYDKVKVPYTNKLCWITCAQTQRLSGGSLDHCTCTRMVWLPDGEKKLNICSFWQLVNFDEFLRYSLIDHGYICYVLCCCFFILIYYILYFVFYSLFLILVQLTLLSLVVYGSTVSAPCCLVVLFHSKCFYVILSYFTALCEWNKIKYSDDDDEILQTTLSSAVI